MTVEELMRQAMKQLTEEYGEREAKALVDEMMLQIKGWDKTKTLINGVKTASNFLEARVWATVKQLLEGYPIQYIFGKAHSYGMDINVTPDTLIPRQETSQLVDMIMDRYKKVTDLKVLDLGTGSGCIAIALGRHLTFPNEITAVDISEKALEVAKQNANNFNVKITFVHADMLQWENLIDRYLYRRYDIIVSNPPYIAQREAAGMERNVLEHEPATALFVPDDDPLVFYRAIAVIAEKRLDDKGTLFLEINPLFAKELAAMLREHGFQDVDIEKDMQKADRFIIAQR